MRLDTTTLVEGLCPTIKFTPLCLSLLGGSLTSCGALGALGCFELFLRGSFRKKHEIQSGVSGLFVSRNITIGLMASNIGQYCFVLILRLLLVF